MLCTAQCGKNEKLPHQNFLLCNVLFSKLVKTLHSRNSCQPVYSDPIPNIPFNFESQLLQTFFSFRYACPNKTPSMQAGVKKGKKAKKAYLKERKIFINGCRDIGIIVGKIQCCQLYLLFLQPNELCLKKFFVKTLYCVI